MKTIFVNYPMPSIMNFPKLHKILKENCEETRHIDVWVKEATEIFERGFTPQYMYHAKCVEGYVSEYGTITIVFNADDECKDCPLIEVCPEIETFTLGGEIEGRSEIKDSPTMTADQPIGMLLNMLADQAEHITFAIQNFMYFLTNYQMNFVRECFDGDPHIISKWNQYCEEEVGSYAGAVVRFFMELSSPNQKKLIEWVGINYSMV